MKIDPLSHVMVVEEALKDAEERKKLIVPVNFEIPYNNLCRQISYYGRVSLLIRDTPGRGKSTFLFTILSKGPKPTFEYRKMKASEQGSSEPECIRNPESFEKIFEIPRKFYRSEELRNMSEEELKRIFETEKNIIIDDIHFLGEKGLSVLKRALETFEDLNIIATVVPPTSFGEEEEAKVDVPRDVISQVIDRFKDVTSVDPLNVQTLKQILRRRVEYALGESKDTNAKRIVEGIVTTIAHFTISLGGYITPRRGIVFLRDYLRGELLRDFEIILQNYFGEANVAATMTPYSVLFRGIKNDHIEFDELRLTSEGIEVARIKLNEPAVVGTVGYSTKHGQVKFYGKIGGKLQSRRRIQIPDIITKNVVISPQILILYVETSNTSVVLYPEVSPPQGLIDKFGDVVRDKYFEIEETNKPITKQTLIQVYRMLQREVRKRDEFKTYVNMMKEKIGFGNVELALDRLILYRSLKAISEIFPVME